VTSVFPLGGSGGNTLRLALNGVNLPASMEWTPPRSAEQPSFIALPLPSVGGSRLEVGIYPEVVEVEPNEVADLVMRDAPFGDDSLDVTLARGEVASDAGPIAPPIELEARLLPCVSRITRRDTHRTRSRIEEWRLQGGGERGPGPGRRRQSRSQWNTLSPIGFLQRKCSRVGP
jgi:hypothetical protein